MRRYGVTFTTYSLRELVGDQIMLSDLVELIDRLNSEIPYTEVSLEGGLLIMYAIEQPVINRMK